MTVAQHAQQIDLHRHLYGSLDPDWWLQHIAQQRSNPGPYESAWLRHYDTPSPLRSILSRLRNDDPSAKEDFRQLFIFSAEKGSGFEAFQLHHDLLTWTSALSDPQLLRRPSQRLAQELPLVVAQAAAQCRAEGLALAELRLMLPAGMRPPVARWAWSLFSHCCQQASSPDCRIDGIASLSRQQAQTQWQELAACLRAGEVNGIVGVDFSHREERSRIQDLQGVCDDIHAFNAAHPEHAVALLLHVGESYQRISLESAVRRIDQAVRLLHPHRLGHAVAAGIDGAHHGLHQRSETVAERLDHITWELSRAAELQAAGINCDPKSLRREHDDLAQRDPNQRLRLDYNQGRLHNWSQLQQWLRKSLRERQQVVEVCPTSTLRIAGIVDPRHHHLHALLRDQVRVVIGSDDPGLFATTLPQECELASSWLGQNCHHLANNMAYASRVMSGRKDSQP